MLRLVLLSSLLSCIGGCPLSCCLTPEQVQKQQQSAPDEQTQMEHLPGKVLPQSIEP
jgi:hypothetical protein